MVMILYTDMCGGGDDDDEVMTVSVLWCGVCSSNSSPFVLVSIMMLVLIVRVCFVLSVVPIYVCLR